MSLDFFQYCEGCSTFSTLVYFGSQLWVFGRISEAIFERRYLSKIKPNLEIAWTLEYKFLKLEYFFNVQKYPQCVFILTISLVWVISTLHNCISRYSSKIQLTWQDFFCNIYIELGMFCSNSIWGIKSISKITKEETLYYME